MRRLNLIAIAVVLVGDTVWAETMIASDPKATSTPTALTEEGDEKGWSFSASASTYIVPNDQEYVQPTSARTAAGCTSRLAMTMRTWKRDRLGSATISAAGKNWNGNLRQCWAACLVTPPASRPATSFRLLIGSSSFPVKASGSSTQAIRREASSTAGPS